MRKPETTMGKFNTKITNNNDDVVVYKHVSIDEAYE